jgi:hypothetical protein
MARLAMKLHDGCERGIADVTLNGWEHKQRARGMYEAQCNVKMVLRARRDSIREE